MTYGPGVTFFGRGRVMSWTFHFWPGDLGSVGVAANVVAGGFGDPRIFRGGARRSEWIAGRRARPPRRGGGMPS